MMRSPIPPKDLIDIASILIAISQIVLLKYINLIKLIRLMIVIDFVLLLFMHATRLLLALENIDIGYPQSPIYISLILLILAYYLKTRYDNKKEEPDRQSGIGGRP